MSQSVSGGKKFAIFKVRVTARAHMIKTLLFLVYLLNADSSATKLGLMIHHHRPECLLKKMNNCIQGPFVTKLGLVMHHHGPECHARRVVCCFQVQGHSGGSY